jgi:hypothetical protein
VASGAGAAKVVDDTNKLVRTTSPQIAISKDGNIYSFAVLKCCGEVM